MEKEKEKIAPNYTPKFSTKDSLSLIRTSRTCLKTKLYVLRNNDEKRNPFRKLLNKLDPIHQCKLSLTEFVQLYTCVKVNINPTICSSNNVTAIDQFIDQISFVDVRHVQQEVSTAYGKRLIEEIVAKSPQIAGEIRNLVKGLDGEESNREETYYDMSSFLETVYVIADLLRDFELDEPCKKLIKNDPSFSRYSFKMSKKKTVKVNNYMIFLLSYKYY